MIYWPTPGIPFPHVAEETKLLILIVFYFKYPFKNLRFLNSTIALNSFDTDFTVPITIAPAKSVYSSIVANLKPAITVHVWVKWITNTNKNIFIIFIRF